MPSDPFLPLLLLAGIADTFDPKIFGPQPSQRIATVLIYLSEVEKGGETVFKKEGLDGELLGRWCEKRRVTVRKCSAVVWWSGAHCDDKRP